MLIDKFPSAKRGRSSLSIRCKCECGTVVKLTEAADLIPHSVGDIRGYDYECPYCLTEQRIPYRKTDKITKFLTSNGISEHSIGRFETLCSPRLTFQKVDAYEILCLQKKTGLSINKDSKEMMEKQCGDVIKAFNEGVLPSEFNRTMFETWRMGSLNAHKGALPDYRILKVATVTKRNSNGYNVPDKIVLRGNDNNCIVLKVDNKGNVTEEWTEPGIYFDKYYVNGFTP